MFSVVNLRIARPWLLLLLGVSAISSAPLIQPAVRQVSALLTARLVPIYQVETPENRLAISFDATWGVDQTDRILEILERYGVKTTFFLAGYWVEKHPEYVKKIAAAGHEVGNHSYAHPHMNRLSTAQILADLRKNHELLAGLIGREPDLFRPPFGEYSDKVIEAARSLGYHTIQWSIDSLDWRETPAQVMVARILERAGPGDIVLFHNAGIHTPAAIERLIPELQSRGFQIVPVGELIYRDSFEVEEHSGLQRPKRTPPLAPDRPSPQPGEPAERVRGL